MITELGHRQAIIGRLWFEETGALLDCKNRRIIMPDEPSMTDVVKNGLEQAIPLQILKRPIPRQDHQDDADRRNRAIAKRDKEQQVRRTYDNSHQENKTIKIERALIEELIPV